MFFFQNDTAVILQFIVVKSFLLDIQFMFEFSTAMTCWYYFELLAYNGRLETRKKYLSFIAGE